MKRVLFVTYHFPPVGGAGVQRSVKFVRYLPDLGYEPLVLTGPGAVDDRWTPIDESMGSEISPSTAVLRVPGPVPRRSVGTRGRAERWLRRRTAFARWWQEGIAIVGREAGDVDLLFATMSPFESAPAVAALARSLDRPWVADLRDPWALDEMVVYPTALHRRLELVRMGRLLRTAAAVVVNTEEARCALLAALQGLDEDAVVAIPNGYDASDFVGPVPARSDSTFRIVHAGYLHTELGFAQRSTGWIRHLIGDATRVDHLARSHVFLLQALDRLLAERPELLERVELHLAGVLSTADRAAISSELRHPEIVKTPGYLSHVETVALLRSADLLFLPMYGLPPGRRARVVPGKTYEYLAAERPILAAVPDGDARDLLARAGAVLCRPDEVNCLMTALAARIGHLDPPVATDGAARAFLKRYERRALTGDLAAVFDHVLTRGPTRRLPARRPAGARARRRR